MSEIISAEIIGDSIRYFDRCGGWIERNGGSENWRTNNPAGIKKHTPPREGEIGATFSGPNYIAIFETYQDGVNAFKAECAENSDNSVTSFLQIYHSKVSPVSICNATNIDCSAKIGDLTENQILALMNEIRQQLDWAVGTQSSYHSGPGGSNYQACPGFDLGNAGPGGAASPPDHTTPNNYWHPPAY